MANCGCSDNIVTPGGYSPCLENCTGTEQSSECIQYVGPDLSNLDIVSGQGLNDVLYNINELGIGTIILKRITIPSINILQLYSDPFIIIPAPGSGKFIQIINVWANMGGTLSIAYTVSGGVLYIQGENASNKAFQAPDAVLGTTNSNIITQFDPMSNFDSIRVNDNILLYGSDFDPTSGTGDLNLFVMYSINSIS